MSGEVDLDAPAPQSARAPTAGTGADDGWSENRYEPVAEPLRYRVPGRGIDPDPTKGWIRRIRPVVLGHKFLFLASLSSSLVGVVAKVLVPRWTGYAINEALAVPAAMRQPLAGYLWVLLGLAGFGLATGFLSRYLLFKVAYELEHDLRTLIYRHLVRLSFPFYDRVQSGQLISRANSDIRSVQMLLAFGPFILVQFAMFFLAVYFMLRIHVGLTLLSIVVLPIVYKVGAVMRSYIFPISWIMQARMADLATIVDENISGVRVIKSFAAEKLQIRALARAAQRLQWVSVLLIRIRARLGPIMENIVRVGEALVLLYGGLLVIDGRIGPGDILVFMAYLVMLQAPFRMLGFLVMMGQRAAASAHRIYEVLDEVPDIRDRPGAIDLAECRGEVEFRDAHFTFAGGPKVLDALDLHVPAGQIVALVGRTGSGKTTIAELIPRLYDLDEGALLIDGRDVRDVTVASLRHHIGICFDEPFLFSTSIRNNIAYGKPDATDEEVVEAAQIAGAHEFITSLSEGYDTVVGERGYTLSGGQRQRIAIARTALEKPRILILDDATSSIDVKIELEIHEGLRRLMTGRTTFIIAHRLSTISLADRVVLLEGGRMVADGTHRELLATEPRYAEVLAHMSEEDQAKAALAQRERQAAVDKESLPDPTRWDPDGLGQPEVR